MKAFLSYCFDDERFVQRVSYYLRSCSKLVTYFYADAKGSGTWAQQVEKALAGCDVFVLFVGAKLGGTQVTEAQLAVSRGCQHLLRVDLLPSAQLPLDLGKFHQIDPIVVRSADAKSTHDCAHEIVKRLGQPWVSDFDVPLGYPFDYEKVIIEEYVKGQGKLSGQRIEQGCSEIWPVVHKKDATHPNPVSDELIGGYCDEQAGIIVDVRTQLQTGDTQPLRLLEARPRARIRYPFPHHNQNLRVGILVSGGIAPGINAVIDGIAERHSLYAKRHDERCRQQGGRGYSLTIYGYREGLMALLRSGANHMLLTAESTKQEAERGGSLLNTSRADQLLEFDAPDKRERDMRKMVQTLSRDGIEILYVIGGDGSMKAAHAIWTVAKNEDMDLSVVGIPKTMDNDILWVWQSFGFLSAVEKAKEFIDQLYTEARSNPRLCVVQLFGSDSGFVVSHAALASGVCDLALVPEVPFSMAKVADYVLDKLRDRYAACAQGQSPYGMIVMAETAIPTDWEQYIEDPVIALEDKEKDAIRRFNSIGRRVYGQTPGSLRTGGLKMVSRVLQQKILDMPDPYWKRFRVFTNEPRHLLRSVQPSVSDVIFGHRLGCLAVDNAMAGYTDFMISQWLTEFVLIPLKLVVLGRKRVPRKGIFWKSVVASTGQPAELAEDSET